MQATKPVYVYTDAGKKENNRDKPKKSPKSKPKKSTTKHKSTKSTKFQYPPPSATTIKYSKSANTPKTKKMKKRGASSWIKQKNIHDPSAPATFSRQTSIMKLRQIASVSKTKKKPKKKTLIDIIYESDEENDPENITSNDEDDIGLMPPTLDRRFGLSADSGMNELLNEKNKEIQESDDIINKKGDNSWVKQKKKKKSNHLKAELSLLFDFRFYCALKYIYHPF